MLGIYCRTSKNRVDKYTIENQREAGIKCANKLNLGFRVYIDDGISGTLDETVRDGLSDLFRDIKKKEITHVYCIDQSRIERDTRTWDFFVAECLNNGIEYYPGSIKFDLDNDTNRMLAKLMSVVNSYYSEITSKKVRLANARKAKEGKTHGLKPYGYRKGANNTYEIYEAEAKYVRKMFELSMKGIGAYTIANILNEEGVPTKFSGNFSGEITRRDKHTNTKIKFTKSKILWRGNVISDMLRNKMYKGIREWWRHEDIIKYENGKQHKEKVPVELIIYNDIPIIIEPEIWDATNENLANNKKNVGKKEQYHYLLNGLIFCSHCKNEVIGKKRLKGSDNAYKCKGKRPPHKTCNASRGISLPKLETFIIHHLFNSKGLKSLLVDAPKDGTQSLKLKKKKIQKEKEKDNTTKAIKRLAQLLINPALEDDETFVADYVSNKTKLVAIEKELANLEIMIGEVDHDVRRKRAKSLIENYSEEVGFDELKRLIHSLIERIIIHHKKEEKGGGFIIVIKYKNYNEESMFLTNWSALKWNWVNHYRSQAIDSNDLEDDSELERYLLQTKSGKVKSKVNDKGFETFTLMSEIINLDPTQLVSFD
jgi:site-specific DNA recombinase